MQVAWSSQRFNAEMGGAFYLTSDGREIECCEVMDVPADFVWPPKDVQADAFHTDDEFGHKGPHTFRWGDLVFEGEVVKFIRSSPKAMERHELELDMVDDADDFSFLEDNPYD